MVSTRALTLLLVLLLPLAAPAQDAPVRIQGISKSAQGTLIQGSWPSACQPAIRSWRRATSGGMDVVLADNASHCVLGSHPFSIELSETEQFSPVPPAGQITPVRVFSARDDSAPSLVGFALHGGQSHDQAPDSGFWWPQDDDDGSGNVLSLELQGDTLGIALLSHDDLSGAPVWYFGTSHLTGQTVHAELTRLDGGSSPFFGMHVQPIPQPGWTIDIAFASSTRAQIWLSRPSPVHRGELDLASMQFARRSFSKEAQTQQWRGTWLVARDAAPDDDGASTVWPARLDFTADQTLDKQHARLIGRDGEFALDCRFSAEDAGSAQNCTLRDAAGLPLAKFDQVGLDRLDGHDMQGHTVILLRAR